MPPRLGQNQKSYRRTFIRAWREHRGLSQDQVVERVREFIPTFQKSKLSRLENAKDAYSQPVLEALAAALMCEPQDLLMRKPDSELWSVVDQLQAVPETEYPRLAAIIGQFRKAS